MFNKKTLLKLLFGVVIFAALVWKIGPGSILESLSSANPIYLLSAVLLTFPAMHLRAARLQTILKGNDINIHLSNLIRICYIGFLFALLTPSKAGDFIRSYYLSRHNKVPYGVSIGVVFIDRMMDLFVLLSVANLGMLYFFIFNRGEGILDSFHAILIIPLLGLLIFYLITRGGILKKIIEFIGFLLKKAVRLEPGKDDGEQVYQDFMDLAGNLRSKPVLMFSSITLSFFIWVTVLFQAWFILLALGENIHFSFVALAIPIAVVAALLPITFSGIGTRDAALVFLFALVGVSQNNAISLSIIFLLMGQGVPAVVGAYFYLRQGN